jgi:serine/threonine-protein kinase
MSTSPPTTLGKYQIIREIARSNDIVYEAYDPAMNRRVALKELAVPAGSSSQQKEERLRRFMREAKAAGSLAHPNIVTVYEVGEDSGRNYIAMEFLDGRTLRNEVDTRGFLPQDRAIEIATDMLCGLDFAHTHGVIHRDIKPENIQILENGTVKLTDFGIARLTFEPNLTMDGQVFGTPSYMSPEQVVGRDLDQRSDLFSVAVVLYEMLCGQKPFTGDSVVSIAMSISNHQPTCPHQIGFGLWQVVEKALDKSAGMRFQTAKEFIDALQVAGRPDVTQAAPQFAPPPGTQTAAFAPMGAYNPYAPPQVGPAYAPPPPVAPPMAPQYGYQQPYGQQPYAPPQGYAPPYGQQQVPVYYPPPPRQPLIKAETKRFLGRLVLTFIILGTFVALIFVGINALTKMINESSKQKRDQAKEAVAARPAPNQTIDDRIVAGERTVRDRESQVGRDRAGAQLADDFTAKARGAAQRGDDAEAAEWYERAIAADKANSIRQSNYADFLVRQASLLSENKPEEYRMLMINASRAFEEAAAGALNDNDRYTWLEKAARCYYVVAQREAARDRVRAREQLYEARRLAPTNSPIRADVDRMITELSG